MRAPQERGQGSGEYAGVLALVGAILATVVVGGPGVGQDVATGITDAICRVSGGDCATGTPQAAPANAPDMRPERCTQGSTKDGYGSTVNIGVVKFGESSEFVATTENVRAADGTVSQEITVVASDGASLGLEGGIGATGELGTSSLGAEAKGSVNGNVKVGDTWKFPDQKSYEDFRKHWEEYEIQQLQLRNDQYGGYAIFLALTNGFIDPPRPPDFTSRTVGSDAGITGELGAKVFGDKTPEDPQGTKEALNLNIGLYGKAKMDENVVTTTDHRPGHEGETSRTYNFTMDGNAGANAVVVGGDVVDGRTAGAFKIDSTTQPDGSEKVTGLTFTTTRGLDVEVDPKGTTGPLTSHKASAGADDKAQNTTVTTTHLKVTDQNRSLVEAWLAENDSGWKESRTLAVPWAAMDPSKPAPEDPFADLLHREATVKREKFTGTSDNFDMGLSLALGLKVGFDANLTDEESTPVSSEYLDAPGPDGVRPYRDNDGC